MKSLLNNYLKKILGYWMLTYLVSMFPSALEAQSGQGKSFEDRLKEAAKPWEYGLICYVQVDPSKEATYLEFVKEWSEKIDNRIIENGYALQSGWIKTEDKTAGSNYIYWIVSREIERLLPTNPLGNMTMHEVRQMIADDVGGKQAEEIWASMNQKFEASAKMVGTQTVALIDWTYSTDWQSVDPDDVRIEFGRMLPLEGKEEAYVNMEKEYFSKLWQSQLAFDDSFTGWSMMKEVSKTGETPEAPFITLRSYRKDRPAPSKDAWDAFMENNLKLPDGTDMSKLRDFKNITYHGVHHSNGMLSPEAKAWSELIGTWSANNTNGGWRKKTIGPLIEEITYYGADGKEKGTRRKPMSIQHMKGLNFFSAHMPQGKYTSVFDLHEDKWYEQSWNIFAAKEGKPDNFWVYTKSDKPEKIDRSDYTKTGPEIDLVKATIQAYAEGDIDTYLSHFTDKAMAGHNSWSAEARFPVKSMSNVHRDHHRQLSKKIEITKSIVELVTLRGGGKHAHAWVHFKHSYKSGDVVEIPVFVAFGINGQNKITYEWAFYDSSQLPADSPYKQ